MLKSFENRALAAFLGWALFVIVMMVSCNVHAQSVTTWKGTVIPVHVVAGADVTISPIDAQFAQQHVGWIQVNITVWPVYSGSRGGLFTYRANKAGVMTKYYLTDEQKAKMTRE